VLTSYGKQPRQRQREETRVTPQEDRAPRAREEKTEGAEVGFGNFRLAIFAFLTPAELLLEMRGVINILAVMMRFFLICGGLIAFAGAAFAEGEYQHTKDGKTSVWNSTPKAGDVSTWNGDRDGEGYATGFGTLTWYTQQRGESALYAVYYGNMVHGKFDGPVNLHVKGKTGHAFFTEGTRTSRWARGPAPNWKGPQKSPESIAKTSAADAGAHRSTPKSSPSTAPTSESSSEQSAQHLKTEATQAAPLAEKRDEEVQRDATAEKLEPSALDSAPSPAKVDGSARALVGPPSTLRANPTPDAPATTPSSASASSELSTAEGGSVPRPADLTEAQAIELANAEAGARGYDLTQYASPKADYSKVKETWSVFYDKKTADSPLIISVEDKTKNALITSPR
jgi:hypothetical protein